MVEFVGRGDFGLASRRNAGAGENAETLLFWMKPAGWSTSGEPESTTGDGTVGD